jgi:hypothetical protein
MKIKVHDIYLITDGDFLALRHLRLCFSSDVRQPYNNSECKKKTKLIPPPLLLSAPDFIHAGFSLCFRNPQED